MTPNEIKAAVFMIEMHAQLMKLGYDLAKADESYQKFMARVLKPLTKENL